MKLTNIAAYLARRPDIPDLISLFEYKYSEHTEQTKQTKHFLIFRCLKL